MEMLKAAWTVTAGLIPGEPMQNFNRTWVYTSEDYEKDGGTQASLRGDSWFKKLQATAHEYATDLELGGLNWVKVEYLWT